MLGFVDRVASRLGFPPQALPALRPRGPLGGRGEHGPAVPPHGRGPPLLPRRRTVAIEASILTNFLLNHLWTWWDRDTPSLGGLARFQVVSVVGLGVNLTLLVTLVGGLHLHYLLADGFGIVGATLWNFHANERWTFSPTAAPGAREESPGGSGPQITRKTPARWPLRGPDNPLGSPGTAAHRDGDIHDGSLSSRAVPGTARGTGSPGLAARPVDIDGNGLYDLLVVDVPLEVHRAGDFTISGPGEPDLSPPTGPPGPPGDGAVVDDPELQRGCPGPGGLGRPVAVGPGGGP